MVFTVVVLFTTVKEKKLAAEMAVYNGGEEEEETGDKGKGGRMEPAVYRSFLFILASIFFLVLFL